MQRETFLLFILLFFAGGCKGQAPAESVESFIDCTEEDRVIFDRYVHAMETKKALPLSDLIVETAQFFLETPYVASTLEKEPERLVINLREMDCTTLTEVSVALARTMKESHPSFESFCLNLRKLRYREGVIRDYTDRLHYFSDWMYENERKGLVKDVTREIGGTPYRLNLSFMSAHPDSYRPLKSHPEWIRTIREKELEITERNAYAMISDDSVKDCDRKMKNGDIVCFVTRIRGLDISHVGIICRQSGNLSFIHASSSAKKVIVEPRPLQVYVKNIQTTAGIMIVRPQ
ncbi:MAG: DUF1460 domain-containing protein [Tannerella sp.]|jgi:hypothetical protein|nr:DUF1460 domain-containing protein [Tannerella sp.]